MKAQIRHKILEVRDHLSTEEVSRQSQKITELFLQSDFSTPLQGHAIMLYASFRGEVDTRWLREALALRGIPLFLPVTGSEILPYEYQGESHLIRSKFGVPEPDPRVCPPGNPSEIDIILVPGIAFDLQGNRLGFGRGYYDRFLPHIPQAVKIGVGYSFQVLPSLPVNERDVPMDFLLTETGLYHCETQSDTIDAAALPL